MIYDASSLFKEALDEMIMKSLLNSLFDDWLSQTLNKMIFDDLFHSVLDPLSDFTSAAAPTRSIVSPRVHFAHKSAA
jgi:hypothetical protein